MFNELNIEISCSEILEACKQLPTEKNNGPDISLNDFFKYGSDTLLPYLHTLFNVLLSKSYFPESWSERFIVPLHEKGSKNDVENYRGITLFSTIGKKFTKIINNRLDGWAKKKKHMYTLRHTRGFVKYGTCRLNVCFAWTHLTFHQ